MAEASAGFENVVTGCTRAWLAYYCEYLKLPPSK